MLINLNDFHKRDRRASEEELSELPKNCPSVNGPAKYEDIFSVDVATDFTRIKGEKDSFGANLKRWTFRMN